MSSYVAFDEMGVFGPAVTLLFQPPITEEGLNGATKLLKTNYCGLSIAHVKATHRQEFCAYLLKRMEQQKPITPVKITKTGFFEKMQCTQLSPLHDRVKSILLPSMLNQAKPFVPSATETYPHQDKINEWLTCFLESYLTQDQLNDHCNFQEILGGNPEITSERNKIGFALYQAFQKGDLTQNDLNAILQGTSSQPGDFLAQADHSAEVSDFTSRYLALFALAGDYSQMLSDTIRSALDTTFRKKCFP